MNGFFSHDEPYYKLVTASSLTPQSHENRNRSEESGREHSVFGVLPTEEDVVPLEM